MNFRHLDPADMDFILRIDLEDEGVDPGYRNNWGEDQYQEHRELIASFISSPDKGGLIAETPNQDRMGLVLWRLRNVKTEQIEPGSLFDEIRDTLPPSGEFCEIFQLWVSPEYRRKGIATTLKLEAEKVPRERGIEMIYTHTEEKNLHVLALNEKLGYREVRLGPIWDDIVRVSLVKDLLPSVSAHNP